MLKIGVIGAGHHSRTFHLPALAHYRTLYPNSIKLVVLCDQDLTRAKVAATDFGFQHFCTDYWEIVRSYSLDGCLILTPPAATLEAARCLLDNTPTALLVEKPLGENLSQARSFLATLNKVHPRTMVSMNRRYDPGLRSAVDWIGKRKIEHVHVTMARVNRTEPQFMWATGLHIVDAVLALVGKPSTWSVESRTISGASWNFLYLRCGETSVQIDLLPTTGNEIEHFEFFGADFVVSVRTGQVRDYGWRAWQSGLLACESSVAAGDPAFVNDGTFAETEAFFAAVRGERAFYPTPSEVQTAAEICAELEPVGLSPV